MKGNIYRSPQKANPVWGRGSLTEFPEKYQIPFLVELCGGLRGALEDGLGWQVERVGGAL